MPAQQLCTSQLIVHLFISCSELACSFTSRKACQCSNTFVQNNDGIWCQGFALHLLLRCVQWVIPFCMTLHTSHFHYLDCNKLLTQKISWHFECLFYIIHKTFCVQCYVEMFIADLVALDKVQTILANLVGRLSTVLHAIVQDYCTFTSQCAIYTIMSSLLSALVLILMSRQRKYPPSFNSKVILYVGVVYCLSDARAHLYHFL